MWAHSNLFPRPTVGNVRDVDAACVCAISGFVCHSLSGGERSRVCVSLTERARSARELGRAERRAHCEAARLGSAHGGGYIVYVSCVGLVISYYFSLWPGPGCACCCVVLRVTRAGPKRWGAGAGARCGGGGRGRDDKQIDGLGAVPRDPSEPQNAENSGGDDLFWFCAAAAFYIDLIRYLCSLLTMDYIDWYRVCGE